MGDDDNDRISQLPEPILHIILSRLPNLKDVARTSVLSKTWGSLWLSTPDLILEEQSFTRDVPSLRGRAKSRQIFEKRLEFITSVDNTVLRLRRHHSHISTNKFRLGINFSCIPGLASLIDEWVEYAVDDAKVEDLCLDIRSSRKIDLRYYKLPEVIFSSNTLRVLYLQFCSIEPNDDDIKLPLLRMISMKNVYIKEHTFQKLLSSSTKIKHVDMSSCHGLENRYSFSSPRLEHVKVGVTDGSEFGKVDVKAMYLLRCLQIYAPSLPMEIRSITSCYSLKEVALFGCILHWVTGWYIQDLISNLPYLENLYLGLCRFIERIDISSPQLKKFELCHCSNLVEVKIDAPNLVHFEFQGSKKTPISLMSTSSHLEVKLSLRASDLSTPQLVDLIEFCKNFNRCKVLTLKVVDDMAIIIRKELRKELFPSLYNVNQLKLIIIRQPTLEAVSMVDSLLWICPRVEVLSLVSKSNHKHIEFVYGEQKASDQVPYCCKSHPRRCWRHFLRKVKIVNFRENEVEKNLQEYFIQNVEMIQILD